MPDRVNIGVLGLGRMGYRYAGTIDMRGYSICVSSCKGVRATCHPVP